MTDPDALDDKPSIEAVIQGTSAYPSGLVTDFGGRAVAEDEYARGPDCSQFLRSQRLTGVCFTFERAWHGLHALSLSPQILKTVSRFCPSRNWPGVRLPLARPRSPPVDDGFPPLGALAQIGRAH